MTLRLLKPSLQYLRSTVVPLIPKTSDVQAEQRLRGKALMTMRTRVLARAGGLCECPDCRNGYPKRITYETFELDHIKRVADGGTNELANFRAVHWQCHARITAQQNAQIARYGCVLDEPEPVMHRAAPQDRDDFPC